MYSNWIGQIRVDDILLGTIISPGGNARSTEAVQAALEEIECSPGVRIQEPFGCASLGRRDSTTAFRPFSLVRDSGAGLSFPRHTMVSWTLGEDGGGAL